MKNSQFGRTMMEMMAILAIIGILSVSGLQLYAKAMNTIRINHLMEKVYLLANQIRNKEIERTNRRKAFDLPLIDETLSYGFSFDSDLSAYKNKEIEVVIKGDFSAKICKMLKKKIKTQEYPGLKDIKADEISLKEKDCPIGDISSMSFIVDSMFTEENIHDE